MCLVKIAVKVLSNGTSCLEQEDNDLSKKQGKKLLVIYNRWKFLIRLIRIAITTVGAKLYKLLFEVHAGNFNKTLT